MILSITVCVVPVRMQEAWLLLNEASTRRAAGNPNGEQPLSLPKLGELEQLPDPKKTLFELIVQASGLTGRRRKSLPVSKYARLVANFIDDFTPLRKLSAFRVLEKRVQQIIEQQHWDYYRSNGTKLEEYVISEADFATPLPADYFNGPSM